MELINVLEISHFILGVGMKMETIYLKMNLAILVKTELSIIIMLLFLGIR